MFHRRLIRVLPTLTSHSSKHTRVAEYGAIWPGSVPPLADYPVSQLWPWCLQALGPEWGLLSLVHIRIGWINFGFGLGCICIFFMHIHIHIHMYIAYVYFSGMCRIDITQMPSSLQVLAHQLRPTLVMVRANQSGLTMLFVLEQRII